MIPTGSDSAVTTPAFRAVVGLHYVWGEGSDEDAPEAREHSRSIPP